MPYLPSFDRTGGVWKPVQAIVPTAAISALAIAAVTGAHIAALQSLPSIAPEASSIQGYAAALRAEPFLIARAVATLIFTVSLTMLVATLPLFAIIGAILLVFGLPAAWLLGRHVRARASIPVALLVAAGAAWMLLDRPDPGDMPIATLSDAWFVAMVALPVLFTGLLYRHFLIAFRDEDELLD